jgi:hypothetical protein
MNEIDDIGGNYRQAFKELADLINRQSPDIREETRRVFGEYLHDIKHTIGLITGATTIILRDLEDGCEDFDSAEMLPIINDAAMRINHYVNLLNETLVTQIDADVVK